MSAAHNLRTDTKNRFDSLVITDFLLNHAKNNNGDAVLYLEHTDGKEYTVILRKQSLHIYWGKKNRRPHSRTYPLSHTELRKRILDRLNNGYVLTEDSDETVFTE